MQSNSTTEQTRNTVATSNISMAYAGDLAHIGTGVEHMEAFSFPAVNLDDDDLTIDDEAGDVLYMNKDEKISVA